MPGKVIGSGSARQAYIGPTVVRGIRVYELTIEARSWHPDTVIHPLDGGEIESKDQDLIRGLSSPDKRDNCRVAIPKIDPLKARGIEVELM